VERRQRALTLARLLAVCCGCRLVPMAITRRTLARLVGSPWLAKYWRVVTCQGGV
jgi:hypothetical protein